MLNKWETEHINHCLSYELPFDSVYKDFKKVIALIKLREWDGYESDSVIQKFHKKIDKNIKDKINPKNKIGLLCSGGEDSIFLLDKIINIHKIKPFLISYRSKNNINDINRLISLNKYFGCKLIVVDKNSIDTSKYYLEFLKKTSRPPNYIAQPIHNYLYFIGKANGCKQIVDGQYCDTLLLSNPQNQYLLWNNKFKSFFKILSLFPKLNFLSSGSKIIDRFNKVQDLNKIKCRSSLILKLCNLENNNKYVSIVKELLLNYDEQIVLSYIFYYVLIKYREKDKYILTPDIISPFEDKFLHNLACANINSFLGFSRRKIPIHNYHKSKFKYKFNSQKTLPFEFK